MLLPDTHNLSPTVSNFPGRTVRQGNGQFWQFRPFHGSRISDQKIFRFFRCLLAKFLFFPMGNGRDNSTIFWPGVLLPFSIDFRGFPAGNGDFSRAFRLFPEVGIIVLGSSPHQVISNKKAMIIFVI
jgi:hypothetical protein